MAATKLKIPPPFDEAMMSLEHELMRFLLWKTGDREDSLDLFQETWLRAYRAYATLESEDGLRPWVYRIAGNLCRNRSRDRARRARVISTDGRDPQVDERRAQAAARESPEAALHLKDVIARLPGKQGQALIMRKFAGLEYREIAGALKCSTQSARASVYQALKKLRR